MKALISKLAPWAALLALAACTIELAPPVAGSAAPTPPSPTSPASPTATAELPTATAIPATITAAPPTEPAPIERTAAVLALVNAERAAAGCPAVTRERHLLAAAQAHSDDMASNDFMEHRGSDGSQAGDRTRAAGYDWRGIGENVAAGYATPEQVVAGWMASDGHRAIMLSCDYREAGVGYAYSAATDYGHYWTLVLAQ